MLGCSLPCLTLKLLCLAPNLPLPSQHTFSHQFTLLLSTISLMQLAS